MKRMTAILLLLIGLVMLSACADVTTAKGTVEYFVEHMKRGNFEEAAKILQPEEFANDFLDMANDPVEHVILRQVLTHAQAEVGPEQVQGDEATVDLTLTPITGEAMQQLREQLKALMPEEGQDYDREEVIDQLMKAADENDWEAFATFKQTLRYHLQTEGDRWKIIGPDTEEMERED